MICDLLPSPLRWFDLLLCCHGGAEHGDDDDETTVYTVRSNYADRWKTSIVLASLEGAEYEKINSGHLVLTEIIVMRLRVYSDSAELLDSDSR